MAEPGDPSSDKPRTSDDHHDDDLIGFASPASLVGQRWAPPASEPVSEPEPEPAPPPVVAPEPEPDLFASRPEPEPQPVVAPVFASTAPPARPADAAAVFQQPTRDFSTRERSREPAPPAGGMSLYAVYALILFAVPTLGVSAAIALFAVTGRAGPDEPLARSHFIYQQRTLWAAAVAALLGGILIVINIGVFVLFVLALWVVARGAFGVIRLKSGRPIENPRGWLF